MEGLPLLTCLIQHTLRGLCTCSSSHSSSDNSPKWVYAVFWRILPRIYPPPKWDYEGGVLDRANGNKRNWILVWEDGFCDLDECEQVQVRNDGFLKGVKFGADIFFKLSHEVYNYGEGLIGKVAAENSHRWVFRDGSNESDPSFISSWNASIDPQPKAWDSHFSSGIKTIAIISVREGIIQLGSFDKILEDLNLAISIQRKFSYLRSIPGLFSVQRQLSTVQHPYSLPKHKIVGNSDETEHVIGSKVIIHGEKSEPHTDPVWSLGPGHNAQEDMRVGPRGPPFWPIPPLLPYNFRSYDNPAKIRNDGVSQGSDDKVSRREDPDREANTGLVVEFGFGPRRMITRESDVNY